MMMVLSTFLILCVVSFYDGVSAYSVVHKSNSQTTVQAQVVSRRSTFLFPFAIVAASTSSAGNANALDMDAFVNSELQKDTKSLDLTPDQALCRFGQPSPETGNACVRAGMSTDRPGKPVDAFGKIDRGDYVRCKSFYVDGKNGKLEKQWKCQ